MAEPTVQAPASLIERVEDELAYRVRTAVAMWRAKDRDGGDRSAAVEAEVRGGRIAVRALLSQPTPSAEPDEWCREEGCRHRHWRSGPMPTHRRGEQCPAPSATPPSIADMAPGTTFTAQTKWGHEWPFVAEGGNAIRATVSGYPNGMGLHDFDIHPSTIRDVTPPAVTS